MADKEPRLRVSHLLVQPVVVWDDGDELRPGPALNPVSLPLSGVEAFVAGLPAEVARFEAQAKAQQDDDTPDL